MTYGIVFLFYKIRFARTELPPGMPDELTAFRNLRTTLPATASLTCFSFKALPEYAS